MRKQMIVAALAAVGSVNAAMAVPPQTPKYTM